MGEREVEEEPDLHPDTEGDFEEDAHTVGARVPVAKGGVGLTVTQEVTERVRGGDRERRVVGEIEVEGDREGEREGVVEKVKAGVTLRMGDKDDVVDKVKAVEGVGVEEKHGEGEEAIDSVGDTVVVRVPPGKLCVNSRDGVGESVPNWVEVRWVEGESEREGETEVEVEGVFLGERVPPEVPDSVNVLRGEGVPPNPVADKRGVKVKEFERVPHEVKVAVPHVESVTVTVGVNCREGEGENVTVVDTVKTRERVGCRGVEVPLPHEDGE